VDKALFLPQTTKKSTGIITRKRTISVTNEVVMSKTIKVIIVIAIN
jgi:hypothetical protein